MSAVGLTVSVGGFSIAIWQIRRSTRAAEAARQAVSDTRDALARNLTIADLVRASERIEEIKRLHRTTEWSRALDRYHDMRLMLADIGARHPRLTEDQRATIQDAITQLTAIELRIARAIQAGTDPERVRRSDSFLLEAQSTVDELASELQQSITSEGSGE